MHCMDLASMSEPFLLRLFQVIRMKAIRHFVSFPFTLSSRVTINYFVSYQSWLACVFRIVGRTCNEGIVQASKVLVLYLRVVRMLQTRPHSRICNHESRIVNAESACPNHMNCEYHACRAQSQESKFKSMVQLWITM